jgi:MFS family permease
VVVVAIGQLSNVAVTVGLVLLGLGWSASTVAGSALVADLSTGAMRLRIQGRSDTIMSLAGAFGGGFAGPILIVVGYAGLAWGAGLLVLVVAAAALVVWRVTPTTPAAPLDATSEVQPAGQAPA